jgi:two-component system cell cycle sensor histidine kinase/response regulator CckA
MRTILLAEDEAPLRKMISGILRDAGYRVVSAASGDEAVNLAAKNRGNIDLLLTDIVMSGMGGADLYAWLKAECPSLRVLFMSGFMSREPVEGAFLKKPFSPAELVEKVRAVLLDTAAAG